MDEINNEVLFVGTAEAEHLEMYLKAIWHIKESGGEAKISSVAKRLTPTQCCPNAQKITRAKACPV